jgi:hypothetical protein
MKKIGIKLAVAGAFLFLVGIVGMSKAYSDCNAVNQPQFSEAYLDALLTCLETFAPGCCANAHSAGQAQGCILSNCGPAAVPPDPEGSIASVACLIENNLHVVKDGGFCQ